MYEGICIAMGFSSNTRLYYFLFALAVVVENNDENGAVNGLDTC